MTHEDWFWLLVEVLVTCRGATHKRPRDPPYLGLWTTPHWKQFTRVSLYPVERKKIMQQCFIYYDDAVSCRPHYSQCLELLIFLPVPLQCWDHRHVPPPCLLRSCDLLQNTSLGRLTRKNFFHKWLSTWNTWKPAGFWRTDSTPPFFKDLFIY